MKDHAPITVARGQTGLIITVRTDEALDLFDYNKKTGDYSVAAPKVISLNPITLDLPRSNLNRHLFSLNGAKGQWSARFQDYRELPEFGATAASFDVSTSRLVVASPLRPLKVRARNIEVPAPTAEPAGFSLPDLRAVLGRLNGMREHGVVFEIDPEGAIRATLKI